MMMMRMRSSLRPFESHLRFRLEHRSKQLMVMSSAAEEEMRVYQPEHDAAVLRSEDS